MKYSFTYNEILPKHRKQPWAIKPKKLAVLNRRLAQARPPYDLGKTAETLETVHFWKAPQFRDFLIYYYSLLEEILPEPYFKHFSKLSYAIYVLLLEEVDADLVERIEILLKDFVRELELHGSEHVTYNMHLLTSCSVGLKQCILM